MREGLQRVRRTSGRHVALLAVLLCVGAIAAAALVVSSAGAASSAGSGQVLKIAQVESGVSEAWDPAQFDDNRTIEIAQNQFEGLLDINADLKVVPNLAQSWSVSKNGLVYTFKLRKGVRFQNGDPVTAQDFLYTFTRSLSPKVASPTSFFLTDIAGADAYLAGKAKSVTGLKVVDRYTFRVTLAHRAGYFPNLVSRWPAWVVDSKVVERYGNAWVKPGHSVGTGAYQLVNQVGDQEFDFKANPQYWGSPKPSIGRVNWYAIPNSTSALARYQTGELDAVLNLSSASVLKVKSDPTLRSQFHTRPLLRTVWLNWDNSKAPFNKKLVRLAFNHAIDKNALVKIALAGEGTPANSWLPPGLPGNIVKTRKPYAFDPSMARKLLAQAGYPGGKGLPKLTIYFTDSLGQQQQVFEFVQGQLQQNLGISIGLKVVPSNSFDTFLKNKATRPLIWGYTFGFDYPDAQEGDQYEFMSGAPYNYQNYSDKRFDRLVAKANASSNQAQRAALYAQADNVMADDAALLPLYFPSTNWIVKPNVKNFALTSLYMRKWNQLTMGG